MVGTHLIRKKSTLSRRRDCLLELLGLKRLVGRLGLLALLGLAGCGPVYHTDYSFTPPKSQVGVNCTLHCENNRLQCRQVEDVQVQSCELRAERDRDYCEDQIRWRKGRDTKWYECTLDSCSANYERCDESYRLCYESCGGKVTATTRCVQNCEQQQTPPAVAR